MCLFSLNAQLEQRNLLSTIVVLAEFLGRPRQLAIPESFTGLLFMVISGRGIQQWELRYAGTLSMSRGMHESEPDVESELGNRTRGWR